MSTIKSENTTVTTTTSTSSTSLAVSFNSTPSNSAFQLPINMSNKITSSSGSTTSMPITTTTTRNNVSVTNIKCEVDDIANGSSSVASLPIIPSTASSYGNLTSSGMMPGVGIRIPLTKIEDSNSESEEELTNIENLKVHRKATSTLGTENAGCDASCAEDCADGGGDSRRSGGGTTHNRNGPRPMSWEGELSENEMTETELMDTENSLSNGIATGISAVGVAVIKREATTTTTSAKHNYHQLHQSQVPHIHPIKPELEIHNNSAGIYSSHHTKLKLGPTQSDPINLKCEPEANVNSPLLARNKSANLPLPANPSPDSAIHSVYTHSSPSQSPLTSRHAPYTPSLSRNNSDASHSSCYSYSSEFSPTHSPIQGRHAPTATPLYGNFNGSLHHSVLYRPVSMESGNGSGLPNTTVEAQNLSMDSQMSPLNIGPEGLASSAAGISRQQLINSPCPICGDKISGFHYGIFSCESCKGFFKRTVQNRKNYVCVRGGPCPVSISTRKKCPACRFDKCLQKGMKLEAIREDRTRGGRSTYQCSYTLPNPMLSPLLSVDQAMAVAGAISNQGQQQGVSPRTPSHGNVTQHGSNGLVVGIHAIKTEQTDGSWTGNSLNGAGSNGTALYTCSGKIRDKHIPQLLQEIMDVEHLWQYNEAELARLNQPLASSSSSPTIDTNRNTSSSAHALASPTSTNASTAATSQMTNPLLASAGLSASGENANPNLIAHLCKVADHRLYKIVKWCKSLPLFKNISIDDQICLLINSWCDLLLFSCCYRSIDTPGEIKMSQGRKITLAVAKSNGLQACIERMLNLTDHMRRLRVDRYEYVAMKVIVLLQSDTSELQEPDKVRECQEKALQSLQAYTLAHYPDTPSKFGELLLRIPDLQRTCQLGKEMIATKSRDGGDFNLLMELLRGEH